MSFSIQTGLMGITGYTSQVALVLGSLGYLLIALISGYLLGSINSAIVISKIFYGEDIRNSGSKNAGTTNMLRVYGKKAALFTLLGDILKTVIAILIGALIGGFQYKAAYSASVTCYVAALFCIIGHIFPVYYKFKGGKGVLCMATAVAILSIKTFAVVIAIFILVVAVTKYVSLGSCAAAFFYPLVWYRQITGSIGRPSLLLISIAIFEMLLIFWCHRANISRLRQGKESKISFKSKKKQEPEQLTESSQDASEDDED